MTRSLCPLECCRKYRERLAELERERVLGVPQRFMTGTDPRPWAADSWQIQTAGEALGVRPEHRLPLWLRAYDPAPVAIGPSALFSIPADPRPERTPAMTETTTTRTEYGKRYIDGLEPIGQIRWESDGRLPFSGLMETVETSDLDALHAAVARQTASGTYRPIELVSRVVTITTSETVGDVAVVKPPVKLPTAKGSVVKATADGERSIFLLDADGDWSRSEPSFEEADYYSDPSDLSDVEVVFDAAGVTL